MKIVKNRNLKYVDEGEGRVILLLHGLTANPYAHTRVIKTLSSDFRVIAPFINLFMRYEKTNRQIKEILEELTTEKVIIIGHSAGSILALNFANEYPEKVSALILIDPVGVYDENNFSPGFYKKTKYLGALLVNHPKLFSISTLYTLRAMFLPKRLIREINFVKNYSQKEIKFMLPTLILWGENDNLTLEKSIHELNKLIVSSKLEFVKGDHNWLMTNPKTLLEKIKEFIDR